MRRSDHGLSSPRAEHWTAQGTCRTHDDPDLWFPSTDDIRGKSGVEGAVYREPRTLCARCPVWQECREHALKHGEEWGMWGGLTPRERRRIAGKAVA